MAAGPADPHTGVPRQSVFVRRRLTDEWSIDLDESFAARVVDGDMQLVSAGPPVRTVWLAIWSPPPEMPLQEVAHTVRAEQRSDPVERFDESSGDEVRLASWHCENVDGRVQWGLYGYTIRQGTYVQSAFIGDDAAERQWALDAWRSLRFMPSEG